MRNHPADRRGVVLAIVTLLLPLLACKALRRPPPGDDTSGAIPKTGPGSGGVVPPGERLQWSDREGIFPVRLNNDEVEDFVGAYRVLDLASSTQSLHVGAFDGATLQRIWGTPTFGTLSEGVISTHVGMAAARVVVTDFRNRAHVLELATGRELGAITLSDRASLVCSPSSPDAHEVWIDVVDKKSVLFDVVSMRTAPAEAPSWCAAQLCQGRPAFACRSKRDVPSVDGVRAGELLRDGPDTVLVGTKTPGTPVPMAVGLEAGSTVARWQSPIPADPATAGFSFNQPAGLAGGRFVAAHEVVTSRKWRLVSLDARTGARGWDVEIPRSSDGSGPSQLVASRTRVYVPHWTWLDVFELSSGKHLGTVGTW